jgi:HAD superfamily hydrolase (TIGR01549 family)
VIHAVVLDFDGVIVESADVKTEAFRALFAPWGEEVAHAVVAHHLRHEGISRFEKFRHAYREILRRPLGPEEERELGERFSALVEDQVVAVPLVHGAREFLETAPVPLYVASGTPGAELARIVARRGLHPYFKAVFGSPSGKGEILRRIVDTGGFERGAVVMVGDAWSDFTGAREAGVSFVGRVRPGSASPFPAGVPVVADLRALAAVLDALGER